MIFRQLSFIILIIFHVSFVIIRFLLEFYHDLWITVDIESIILIIHLYLFIIMNFQALILENLTVILIIIWICFEKSGNFHSIVVILCSIIDSYLIIRYFGLLNRPFSSLGDCFLVLFYLIFLIFLLILFIGIRLHWLLILFVVVLRRCLNGISLKYLRSWKNS